MDCVIVSHFPDCCLKADGSGADFRSRVAFAHEAQIPVGVTARRADRQENYRSCGFPATFRKL